jgi:hypothetical protein
MKHFLLVLTAIGFFSTASFSQISKGTWMVGGDLGFNKSTKNNDIFDPTLTTEKNTSRNFSTNLHAGYFLMDNLVVGLAPNYSSNKYTQKRTNLEDDEVYQYESSGNSIGISPFIRQYKQLFSSKAYIFGQAAINIAHGKSHYESGNSTFSTGTQLNKNSYNTPSNTYGISLSPGVNYFITDKIALEVIFAGLSISSTNTKKDEIYFSGTTTSLSTEDGKNVNFDFNLNLSSISLGLNFFLGKK